jgi:hypothetical protein
MSYAAWTATTIVPHLAAAQKQAAESTAGLPEDAQLTMHYESD